MTLHPRNTLPPPRRVGLRYPTPVGHGRGLASRPGCAGPGEGIDSARRRLHRFRRGGSPRPSRFRLRLRSSMPGETTYSKVFCPFPGVNRPLHPSFTSFGRGSAMSAVYAFACHRTSIHNRRSGSRLVILNPTKLQQEAATAPDKSVTVAARSAPRQFSPHSPPSHQR